MWKISWDRGQLQGLGGEPINQSVTGRSEMHTDGPCRSHVCPDLGRVSPGADGGPVLESGTWSRLRERTAVGSACEWAGVRSSTTGNAHGVSRGSLPAHLRALSLQALRGAPTHMGMRTCLPLPSPPPPHPSTTASTPPPWAGLCAPGQLQEQTLVGDPHTEVKPQLSPRGCPTKGEELKSLLMAVRNVDLRPDSQLCKHSVHGASKQENITPAVETGLALSAVGFMST